MFIFIYDHFFYSFKHNLYNNSKYYFPLINEDENENKNNINNFNNLRNLSNISSISKFSDNNDILIKENLDEDKKSENVLLIKNKYIYIYNLEKNEVSKVENIKLKKMMKIIMECFLKIIN